MSYERCVATYREMREKHRNDPEKLEAIEQFGRNIAYQRTHDELAAKYQARLAIEKAKRSAQRGS